jgi:hypothetical protein
LAIASIAWIVTDHLSGCIAPIPLKNSTAARRAFGGGEPRAQD